MHRNNPLPNLSLPTILYRHILNLMTVINLPYNMLASSLDILLASRIVKLNFGGGVKGRDFVALMYWYLAQAADYVCGIDVACAGGLVDLGIDMADLVDYGGPLETLLEVRDHIWFLFLFF